MKNSTYSQLKNLLNEIVIVINSKRIILDVNKFFMSFIDCYDISSVVNTKIDLFLDDEGSKKIREFIINRKDKLTYNKATITLTLNLLGKPVNIRMYRKIINKDNDEIVLLSVNCEKRLQNLEYERAMLLDSLPGSVYWKDTNGRYLGCNKFVLEMAGLKAHSEIIGKTDYDLCWREFADDWSQADKEVIETGQSIVLEEQVRLSTGEVLTELTYKSPYIDFKKNIIGIIGSSLDITELKNTQKQLKKANTEREKILKRHEQFMDDQAHDIRTPVGGIISGTEVLPAIISQSPQDALGWVKEIHNAATQILDYQESLLHDLYHGLRKSRTIFARFDLVDMMKQLYTLYLPGAKTKNIVLNYDIDKEIPTYLIGDAKRTYQCLIDLMSNAVKFTPVGKVTITVKLASLSKKQAVLRFSVFDTGVGIAENMQHDIYENFFKAAPSNQTQTQGHGRGLGLPRVKRLVDLMKGELWLESELGKGSCFHMVLPFKISMDQND